MASSASDTTIATDALTSSGTHPSTARESNPSIITTTITSYSTATLSTGSTLSLILGPLTTTYTAPTQCSQAYWAYDSARFYDPTMGQTCATISGEIPYTQENDCLPPVTKSTIIGSLVGSSTITSTTYNYTGYYSPGIACPARYTTACAVQAGTNAVQSAVSTFQSFDFVYSAMANETAVGCCPRDYQCQIVSSSQWCQQIIAAPTQQPLVTCSNATNSVVALTTQLTLPTVIIFSSTNTTISSAVTSTTAAVSTISLLATMIQLNFKASDLPPSSSLLPSSSSSTSTSLSSTLIGTSSSSSSHKTTTIAVAVVISCVAVLIAAGLGWFWYRRGAKKRLSPSYQATQLTEHSDMDYRASGVPSELAGDSARFEVAGTVPQYEIVGTDSC